VNAMRAYWGVRLQSHSLLTFVIDGGSGGLHAPAVLLSKKEPHPRDPLNERLGDLPSRSGRFEEEINLLSLPGIEPRFLGRQAWSLHRQSHPSSL
jgi:hypothetical protein